MAHPLSNFARIVAVISLSIAALAAVLHAAQTRQAATTALFTDAQAKAGEAVYAQSCAACHGATLDRRHRAGAGRPGVCAQLERPASHARRPLLRHPHDDAAARCGRADSGREGGGVRVHPQEQRLFAWLDGAGCRDRSAQGSATRGQRERARDRSRPAPPAFIAGAAGAAPAGGRTGSGDA